MHSKRKKYYSGHRCIWCGHIVWPWQSRTELIHGDDDHNLCVFGLLHNPHCLTGFTMIKREKLKYKWWFLSIYKKEKKYWWFYS
jgi:hypothetical protein